METLMDKLTIMSKAQAHDKVVEQNTKLKIEIKTLKERIMVLENLINEYTTKMLNNLK